MANHLNFENKNLFRKYPVRASCSLESLTGELLDNALIADARFTADIAHSKIFIKQISYGNGFVSITISCQLTTLTEAVVGFFKSKITTDFQTIPLSATKYGVSGAITLGFAESFQGSTKNLNFTYDTTNLEARTVVIKKVPTITSISDENKKKLTGFVEFGTLINLQKSYLDGYVNFKVTSPSGFESLADRSSLFGNCPTPIITQINSVVPYTPDSSFANNNNIYILGVDPVIFYNSDPGVIRLVTPGIDLETFCTARSVLLPPVEAGYLINIDEVAFEGKKKYFSKSETPMRGFVENVKPEFASWPNFVKSFTRTLEVTTNGTFTIADTVQTDMAFASGDKAQIVKIKVKSSSNSPFRIQLLKNAVAITENLSGSTNGKVFINDGEDGTVNVLEKKSACQITDTDILTVQISNLVDPITLKYTLFYKNVFEL